MIKSNLLQQFFLFRYFAFNFCRNFLERFLCYRNKLIAIRYLRELTISGDLIGFTIIEGWSKNLIYLATG